MSEIALVADIIAAIMQLMETEQTSRSARGSKSAQALVWMLHEDKSVRAELIEQMRADPELITMIANVAEHISSSVLRALVIEADGKP